MLYLNGLGWVVELIKLIKKFLKSEDIFWDYFNYELNICANIRTAPKVIKLFCPKFANFCNKLVFGWLGRKTLPGTNTLSFYENS